MITKARVRNYRKLRDVEFSPNRGMNILVGDNASGKSTLLEALILVLTGRINGRSAEEELNPYWFNEDAVREFFSAREAGKRPALPTLSIEIFLADLDEYQRLVGAHNSEVPTKAHPGVSLTVEPNPDYADELERFLGTSSTVLPTDFYHVVWRDFADNALLNRPRTLRTAVIDSRTVRSTSGIDFHLRQLLSDHLAPEEKAKVSVAYSRLKDELTRSELKEVNEKISGLSGTLDKQSLRLGMDQTSKAAWDNSVVPYVSNIPFSMAGQGQQASVKICLALDRHSNVCRFVMVEEPENHLSHTNLNTLLRRVSESGPEQQLFVTTHSSFVLNRLGLGGLLLLCDGKVSQLASISDGTIRYFQRLPGYDTLRMALADRFVMVEGPSDEILFERFYKDKHGCRPIENGVDVISMRGLAFKRGLELAQLLGKKCAVIRDNDGKPTATHLANLSELLQKGLREAFVGDEVAGATLEPQLIYANDEEVLASALELGTDVDLPDWMSKHKTECALAAAFSETKLNPPSYIASAIDFIHDAK